MTAVLAILVLGHFCWGMPRDIKTWVFLFLLGFPAAEDLETGMISDVWGFLLTAGGILFGITGFTHFLVTAAVTIGMFLLSEYSSHFIGSGDVLMMGAVSLWLTPVSAMCFIWISFALGLVYFLILVVFGKKGWHDFIPFAPCIALGGGAAYVWNAEITEALTSLWETSCLYTF